MIKGSIKKIFLYISLSIILTYFCFVLICYNAGTFNELYSLNTCSIYYITVYLLLAATTYCIDINSRKEPALLTLFCLPIYSAIFLLSFMMMGAVEWYLIILMLLTIGILYILGYYCYKKWIEKILLVKNGYENILMIYDILHLFTVLFIAFKILGLL